MTTPEAISHNLTMITGHVRIPLQGLYEIRVKDDAGTHLSIPVITKWKEDGTNSELISFIDVRNLMPCGTMACVERVEYSHPPYAVVDPDRLADVAKIISVTRVAARTILANKESEDAFLSQNEIQGYVERMIKDIRSSNVPNISTLREYLTRQVEHLWKNPF